MARRTPIVVDCDPGHDDAVAILLALGSPEVELLGVTTTFGNCAVADATRNAQRVLALAGRSDVPVAVGAAGPIAGDADLGNYVHGTSGLDGPPLPEPQRPPIDEAAVEFLTRTLTSSPEAVTLVAIGPMTNIGLLLRDHPEVRNKVAEIIFMGGSTERGNHTPTAEFNTHADPEALDIVLRSGLPVRMVGLNLTHQALATPGVVERMSAMGHVVGRTCAEWMGFFGGSYNRIWEFEAPPVHDPCTIAAIIDPSVIEWREAFVVTELDGTWTRGTTVVDLFRRYPDQAANVSVAMTLDVERYWDLVLNSLDRLGAAS
ncbi:nucleoside hydrolase [Nocardioides sp.]|uniref:nucleoside hydrolase n=1 Tax=Nocardioides sp. TaxID=35761 RepID=UPI0027364DD6|nr:nucleoside hydrolase [Nocardioides sp.]MDP3894781.1 nucleoside hydrolase [Nocardioides sp.]